MKSSILCCTAFCLICLVYFNLHGGNPSSTVRAASPVPLSPIAARPLMISNEEWTFNLNNVCTAGPLSVYHLLGTKYPMMLTLRGLEDAVTRLVDGGTWIKTGMPKYINLNTVASAQVTKTEPREIEITFSDGFKEQLTGDDVKLFTEAAAKLAAR